MSHTTLLIFQLSLLSPLDLRESKKTKKGNHYINLKLRQKREEGGMYAKKKTDPNKRHKSSQ